MDSQQSCEQAVFETGHSTIDHLHAINQLIEKSYEYQKKLTLIFVDFTKAFDSLNHEFMFQSLINQSVPLLYVKLITRMYENIQARISTDIEGEYFKIKKGVRQGDPQSPILFNVALEETFRSLKWAKKGIKIEGEYLNNLRFARRCGSDGRKIKRYSKNVKRSNGGK